MHPSKTHGKKTVIIEKSSSKPFYKSSFKKPLDNKTKSSNFKKGAFLKTGPGFKNSTTVSDFERRKLAEQRATKRLKGETEKDKKNKLSIKKRETKLNSFKSFK